MERGVAEHQEEAAALQSPLLLRVCACALPALPVQEFVAAGVLARQLPVQAAPVMCCCCPVFPVTSGHSVNAFLCALFCGRQELYCTAGEDAGAGRRCDRRLDRAWRQRGRRAASPQGSAGHLRPADAIDRGLYPWEIAANAQQVASAASHFRDQLGTKCPLLRSRWPLQHRIFVHLRAGYLFMSAFCKLVLQADDSLNLLCNY
jgi:hypothetical protein